MKILLRNKKYKFIGFLFGITILSGLQCYFKPNLIILILLCLLSILIELQKLRIGYIFFVNFIYMLWYLLTLKQHGNNVFIFFGIKKFSNPENSNISCSDNIIAKEILKEEGKKNVRQDYNFPKTEDKGLEILDDSKNTDLNKEYNNANESNSSGKQIYKKNDEIPIGISHKEENNNVLNDVELMIRDKKTSHIKSDSNEESIHTPCETNEDAEYNYLTCKKDEAIATVFYYDYIKNYLKDKHQVYLTTPCDDSVFDGLNNTMRYNTDFVKLNYEILRNINYSGSEAFNDLREYLLNIYEYWAKHLDDQQVIYVILNDTFFCYILHHNKNIIFIRDSSKRNDKISFPVNKNQKSIEFSYNTLHLIIYIQKNKLNAIYEHLEKEINQNRNITFNCTSEIIKGAIDNTTTRMCFFTLTLKYFLIFNPICFSIHTNYYYLRCVDDSQKSKKYVKVIEKLDRCDVRLIKL
ncbi:hypothetical protein TCON_0923 [Astathelohania contejeani]|uniref:Uncharacterized protein n=1 Tax=Astathelohania contejeani TaxID=164912 RepID=A0ABQ7I089_9MICR|nr:hypothetical protein TCON_0923 [Thelohania contejeani]